MRRKSLFLLVIIKNILLNRFKQCLILLVFYYIQTVDYIYLWRHARKTCFHMRSNVQVSGVKLWSFLAQMWSCPFWHCPKGRCFQSTRKEEISNRCPTSTDLHNQVKELAQDYCFSEVGRRLRISKGAVSKIVKPYNLTGSTAPKKLNHVRTVPKCTFQDSILLETMVQARGSSSLKELRDDFAIHGDWGELSTSTISRNIRNKLPSGRNYSRKRLGNVRPSVLLPKI